MGPQSRRVRDEAVTLQALRWGRPNELAPSATCQTETEGPVLQGWPAPPARAANSLPSTSEMASRRGHYSGSHHYPQKAVLRDREPRGEVGDGPSLLHRELCGFTEPPGTRFHRIAALCLPTKLPSRTDMSSTFSSRAHGDQGPAAGPRLAWPGFCWSLSAPFWGRLEARSRRPTCQRSDAFRHVRRQVKSGKVPAAQYW